ncbi:MAG: purine permease [Anaerovibrio sp.]|uniref:uracil-xanthine permease family protein n=1 Tax=Anaerovibrio sp. TaxID=1872532 RepID=UPI0025CE7770|nr:nucleobase:cation symporter-2 family protein [Anaerovibrio sp.]MCR5175880.1 purine permease [Anaerovibrio sp.]
MTTADINNIYKLDGRVPFFKALPYGIQHILAMFVANITPIVIVAGAAQLGRDNTAMLIQNAMVIAGIATLIQLYPVWRIGSRLPIVMGVSFTFVSALCMVVTVYGYNAAIGAILVGGICEGFLGLFAKYWRRLITPIVASTVVTAIGYSLLTVGIRSFGGGYNDSFGNPDNLIVGTITLVVCLLFNIIAKGPLKQLSVLAGLIVGYVAAIAYGMVDISSIFSGGVISIPVFIPFAPEFNIHAILTMVTIFMVSAAETIGDTSAMTATGLGRPIKEREISGSLACDGFASSLSSLFGCPPVTSFSQNVGLIAMTKVVNRFTIMTGALCMIMAGLFPPIGAIFASLPDPVLGGCTIIMFGSIMVSGINMMSESGFNQRNTIISALSFSIGIGATAPSEIAIWHSLPQFVQDIFAGNCVAVVFIVAVILNLVLPKEMDK